MMYQYILDQLPYKSSFRFVDEISFAGPDEVIGHYTLRPEAFFYADHFPGNPVTPGAILTEIMAQIGLVVMGIYLVADADGGNRAADASSSAVFPLLTSADVSFLRMVLPGQKLTVISKKVYFRWDKLKCRVELQDETGDLIAKGFFSGMIKKVSK